MIVRPSSGVLGIAMVLLGLGLSLVTGARGDEPPAAAPADPTKGAQPDAKAKAAEPGTTTGTDSDSTAKPEVAKPKIEKATFGSGCFWCGEAVFERIKGVKTVVSGYAGGNVPNPTYEMVSSGETGHAEVFQVTYDSSVVTYDTLLKVFWASHDPTTLNEQGPDFGTQYRSVIFYHDEAQRLAAQKSFQGLSDKNRNLASLVVTQLLPMPVFYPAEAYHQDYYRRHKNAMYCQTYIVPKLRKLHLPLK
jgi:peptide-methionine (S)-S-oxide reductase